MNHILKYNPQNIFILLSLITFLVNAHAQDVKEASLEQMGLVLGLDTIGLKTGDLVFFQGKSFDAVMTQIGTASLFTHVALVVMDQDDTPYLIHATPNNYNGVGIPVRNEAKTRAGIIYTKLADSFLSTNQGKTGFYKRIWIRKMNDSKVKRPATDELLDLYEKHKVLPFEKSKLRFILTAFDLNICNRDLLSLADTETLMCSELVFSILRELNLPIIKTQACNEYSPINIYHMTSHFYQQPIEYHFREGMFRLVD